MDQQKYIQSIMRKLTEIFLIFISICGIPNSIIDPIFPSFYQESYKTIWVITIVMAILLSLTQFDSTTSPRLTKTFRTVRFYLFRTKTISIILLLQLITVICVSYFNPSAIENKTVLLSIALNVVGINLLIITEKLLNSDFKKILLKTSSSPNVYLYANNSLRHIPDPPTLELLGLLWGNIVEITDRELATYRKLPPITSIIWMEIVRYKNVVYGIVNDRLKEIPNQTTLNFIIECGNKSPIKEINSLNGYIKDDAFVSR